MNKNKKGILAVSIFILALGTVFIRQNLKTSNSNIKTDVKPNISFSGKIISGLPELKSKADTIVEIIGTDNSKVFDYKGVSSTITTVTVTNVLKGDKKLNEINIIQLTGEITPENGQKLLLFLRKGIDNPDCYVPIGAGQGIYKIVQSKSKVNSLDSNLSNMVIEPQSIVNDDILKDLSGNYEDVKKKLSE